MPGSRREYWGPKLAKNRQRDVLVRHSLKEQGWRSLIVWECELKSTPGVVKKIKRFLTPGIEVIMHGTHARTRESQLDA
jgi:DNA mismatch endonuclease, patch repair protein